jgi:hypothetical protein
MTKKLITVLGITGTQVCLSPTFYVRSSAETCFRAALLPVGFYPTPTGAYADSRVTPVPPKPKSGRIKALKS